MNNSKIFDFGKNWKNFLNDIDETRIYNSINSLKTFTGLKNLNNLKFLDVGSGSGLSSLAARRLGANVYSFDYDEFSVEATNSLKNKFSQGDRNWQINQGSVLDEKFLKGLGEFDIVYSWGVLHHTGNMTKALNNVNINVKKEGLLFIAIYNDQGIKSIFWKKLKYIYVKYKILRPVLILFGYLLFLPSKIFKFFLKTIGSNIQTKFQKRRGMSFHYDIVDWIGGYPFEVSTPEKIIHFYLSKGYNLIKLKTCKGKLGCNEFLFKKI